MGTVLRKKFLETDVKEEAKKRIAQCYRDYDKVVVNFSGGKDSTAMLYLTIEVATELNLLPVLCVYVDHEVEGEGTAEICDQIAQMPEVEFTRYCIPFALRNACSYDHGEWYPWHPQEEALWVRSIPPDAVTELAGADFEYDAEYQDPDGLPFKAAGVTKAVSLQYILNVHLQIYQNQGYTAISFVGMRAEESMARYCAMARRPDESWLSSTLSCAYVLFDWSARDVWKYIRDTGKPWNQEYAVMNQTRLHNKLLAQRVGSIFGEEALRNLDLWHLMYGDYWHKILERVSGAKTAWRYCNTGIYSGGRGAGKDPKMLWSEYLSVILSKTKGKHRGYALDAVDYCVKWHNKMTAEPIGEAREDGNPLTGMTYEFLCKIAIRADTKQRGRQAIVTLGKPIRRKLGMTRDEAVKKYGRPEYIQAYFTKHPNGIPERQD